MGNQQGGNGTNQGLSQERDRQQPLDQQQNQASQHGSGQSGYGSGSDVNQEREAGQKNDRQQQNQGAQQSGTAESSAGASEQNDHYGYQDGREHDQERRDE